LRLLAKYVWHGGRASRVAALALRPNGLCQQPLAVTVQKRVADKIWFPTQRTAGDPSGNNP